MLALVLAVALCLSVSVRHKSVFYQNRSTARAGFWHEDFPTVCYDEFRYLQK